MSHDPERVTLIKNLLRVFKYEGANSRALRRERERLEQRSAVELRHEWQQVANSDAAKPHIKPSR